MNRQRFVQIENKNALVELLREGRKFSKILLSNNVYKDDITKEIVQLASYTQTPIERLTKKQINRKVRGHFAPSIMGLMELEDQIDINELMDRIYGRQEDPFLLVFDDIRYVQNIGAIIRTAFAAGVNGIIVPASKRNFLNDEIIRISLGAALRIPIIEMNVFMALKTIKENDIRIVALETGGKEMYDVDLTGPKAIVLGTEESGISKRIMERADSTVEIPMREGIASLNVSVSAAVVMYEKVRQEKLKALKG